MVCRLIGLSVCLREFALWFSGGGRSGRSTSTEVFLFELYIILDSDRADLTDAAASRMSRGHFESLAMWSLKGVAFGNSYLAQQNLHTAGPLGLLSTSKSTQIFERDLTMAAERSDRSKQTLLPSSENSARCTQGFAKLKQSAGGLDWILLDLPFGSGFFCFFCWQLPDE